MRALLSWLLIAASIATSHGYVFLSPVMRWPDGNVPMDLQLDATARQDPVLVDGKTSWDDVASEALGTWNAVLSRIHFTGISAPGRGDGNGRNEAYFSGNVFGHAFGQDVLAVTTIWHVGNRRTEGDTIFNSRDFVWDSYRGPLRGQTIDLRRVAIHEFGHTVGLDHPDEARQVVIAQMNSTISDLDDLAEDDIRGAHALYPSAASRYAINVTVEPSAAAGSVIIRPPPPSGGYRPGTLVSVTPRAKPGFRFNYWLVNDAPGALRATRFRIFDDTSLTAVFVTNTAPRLSVPPRSQRAQQGDTIGFSATPAAPGRFTYQWMHNGRIIEGATNRFLTLPGVLMNQSGLYSVVVGNRRSQADSRPALLIVTN